MNHKFEFEATRSMATGKVGGFGNRSLTQADLDLHHRHRMVPSMSANRSLSEATVRANKKAENENLLCKENTSKTRSSRIMNFFQVIKQNQVDPTPPQRSRSQNDKNKH